jgi:hypothetical protein
MRDRVPLDVDLDAGSECKTEGKGVDLFTGSEFDLGYNRRTNHQGTFGVEKTDVDVHVELMRTETMPAGKVELAEGCVLGNERR